MRYYSTQRPIVPGSYPKPKYNKVLDLFNYEGKTYCEEINMEAWGYVDYEKPLGEKDAKDYELVSASEENTGGNQNDK